MDSTDVPNLDISIEEDCVKDNVTPIITLLRPTWSLDDIKIESKSIGYMNKNYLISVIDNPTKGEDGLFLRLINEKYNNLRAVTINAMKYQKVHKLGAELLLTFNNGLVMEYLPGETLKWDQHDKVLEPAIWLGIAEEMARWHAATDTNDVKKFNIRSYEQVQATWLQEVKAVFSSGKIKASDLEALPSPTEIENCYAEVNRKLQDLNAELCYLRYDANYTNFVITEDRGVVFVDYDACFVDFAVLEMIGVIMTACKVMDVNTDLKSGPSDDDIENFLRRYLEKRFELDPSRGAVTQSQIQEWKHLIDIAKISKCLFIVVVIPLMQGLSDKPVDMGISHKYWKEYLRVRDSMKETFQ